MAGAVAFGGIAYAIKKKPAKITELLEQEAKIDSFGVGENLIVGGILAGFDTGAASGTTINTSINFANISVTTSSYYAFVGGLVGGSDQTNNTAKTLSFANCYNLTDIYYEGSESEWQSVIIGSEGGFSRGEEVLANDKGFASVTLGKRILRAETAAVALTSVVMFVLGELR